MSKDLWLTSIKFFSLWDILLEPVFLPSQIFEMYISDCRASGLQDIKKRAIREKSMNINIHLNSEMCLLSTLIFLPSTQKLVWFEQIFAWPHKRLSGCKLPETWITFDSLGHDKRWQMMQIKLLLKLWHYLQMKHLPTFSVYLWDPGILWNIPGILYAKHHASHMIRRTNLTDFSINVANICIAFLKTRADSDRLLLSAGIIDWTEPVIHTISFSPDFFIQNSSAVSVIKGTIFGL